VWYRGLQSTYILCTHFVFKPFLVNRTCLYSRLQQCLDSFHKSLPRTKPCQLYVSDWNRNDEEKCSLRRVCPVRRDPVTMKCDRLKCSKRARLSAHCKLMRCHEMNQEWLVVVRVAWLAPAVSSCPLPAKPVSSPSETTDVTLAFSPLFDVVVQWYSTFFYCRIPRCNFSSTLYPQSCLRIIQVTYSL
jgi:hypothetical protein